MNIINKLKELICYRTINKKKLLDQMVSRFGDSACNTDLARLVLKSWARKQTLDGVEFYVLDEDSFDIICKYFFPLARPMQMYLR